MRAYSQLKRMIGQHDERLGKTQCAYSAYLKPKGERETWRGEKRNAEDDWGLTRKKMPTGCWGGRKQVEGPTYLTISLLPQDPHRVSGHRVRVRACEGLKERLMRLNVGRWRVLSPS